MQGQNKEETSKEKIRKKKNVDNNQYNEFRK
jgi:hypothetical protein